MSGTGYAQARAERTGWWIKERFGMFIHWGLYAIPARGEWVRSVEELGDEDYERYFREFNPARCDLREWAKIAKQAGMKYAILTAKHHEGFCLFDSALTDYKSTNTPAGRDFVREFTDAFRAEGLRVGLYYSLIDWHHPDYPAFGDRYHPLRNDAAAKREPERFERYLAYMHGQIRELLTNYGRLDMMWFDFSYGEMSGEKWEATRLMETIRELQPHVLVDNRLEETGPGNLGIHAAEPGFYSGDFASPEQYIPPCGLTDETGAAIPWEACITLNNSWGYTAGDRNWKSAAIVIRKLIECVSRDGNLLLNVGPDAQGEIPQATARILAEVGEWLRLNGDSIYGCGGAGLPRPEWGLFTRSGDRLFAHIFEQSVGPYYLPALPEGALSARLLSDGAEWTVGDNRRIPTKPSETFFNAAKPEFHTYPLPDERSTVVELTKAKERS